MESSSRVHEKLYRTKRQKKEYREKIESKEKYLDRVKSFDPKTTKPEKSLKDIVNIFGK